jgi:hypothetical protein
MRIERTGSRRNHGTVRIEASTQIQWDSVVKGVRLSARGVSDFNTNASHDYEFWLSPGEVARVLSAAAVAEGKGEAPDLVSGLAARLPTLVRLGGPVGGG